MISCLRVSTSRTELLHSYGFEHVNVLNNLEKAGLLKKQVWLFLATLWDEQSSCLLGLSVSDILRGCCTFVWFLQEFKSNWQTVKRTLKLIVEDTDTLR